MNLGTLVSESRNPASMTLDTLTTLQMVTLFNEEDGKVPTAIRQVLPAIAQAVELAAEGMRAGGRLIYLGAGTSGRLGVLDASECPPTFGVPQGLVIGVIAGGPDALLTAVEGAEDDPARGRADLVALSLTAQDTVIGIAASGRTPYVIGALTYAGELGCRTVALSCNPAAPIAALAKVAIAPLVGPEALTGSTRMKSGTAQKLVLNMISTGVMVRLGKVYQNLMVDVKATNLKLIDRACRIVMDATGVERAEAEQALRATDYAAKPAILMILAGCDAAEAQRRLATHQGYLRAALSA